DAALLADDAAILHALVLAAQALVILDRPEDPGAEQPVPFRLERPVVDRFRLLDLAIGPGPDALRAGDLDLDLIEGLRRGHLADERHQFVHSPAPLAIGTVRKARTAAACGGETAGAAGARGTGRSARRAVINSCAAPVRR